MKTRNLLIGVLIFAFTLLAFFTSSQAADYPAMKLKVASLYPAGSFTNNITEWLCQEIEKRTSGKITFERYYGSVLLKGAETAEGVQHGVADMAFIVPAYTAGKLPIAYNMGYAFPFAPKKLADAISIASQLYTEFPWMHDELTAFNLKMINLGGASDYGLLSRKPVRTLADLKGMKVVQLGGAFAEWTKAAGITPVSGITNADRYERLRSGVVDGALLSPTNFVDFKEYEVAKNLMLFGVGARFACMTVMNLDVWKKMSPETQKLFMEVGQEVQNRFGKACDDEMDKSIDILKSYKVKYWGYLSAADTKTWASSVPDTPAAFCKAQEGKYPEIWKLAHRYIELAEKRGHKWPMPLAVKK